MLQGRITNAPHVPRARAFLDGPSMVQNPIRVFESYRAQYGHTFSFHFGGAKPAIVSTDPAFLQRVLQKNQTNYNKSDIQVERMGEFQGQGLLNSHGAAWLRQRRLLAKGFLRSRLTRMLPMQLEILDELMTSFDKEATRGPVEIRQQMVRFTLRLVGKSLLGRSMGDAELQEIGDAISQIQEFIVRQIVQPYKIPWFQLSGQSAHYQKIRRDADRIVLRHIQAQRGEEGGDDDFLRLLLDTPCEETGEPMSEEQVMIESLQLMVAGNETSSNALSWIFYLLARHPDHLARIRGEIDAVIGDKPLDFEALHALEKTLQVIDEAMRLYPPFWMVDRIALEDDEICGIEIPAGTMVIPYIYGTHRNPAFWSDAESFDPSRFDPDRRKERNGFAYIPFGAGPRICIGNNMAILQILMIVTSVVRAYDFELLTDQPVGIRPMMILRPDGPITMRFRRIARA
jgi:cytochrome P450